MTSARGLKQPKLSKLGTQPTANRVVKGSGNQIIMEKRHGLNGFLPKMKGCLWAKSYLAFPQYELTKRVQ
jgi:hypothetical protein